MRALLLLLALPLAASATCPNFAGTYSCTHKVEETTVVESLVITQDGAKITFKNQGEPEVSYNLKAPTKFIEELNEERIEINATVACTPQTLLITGKNVEYGITVNMTMTKTAAGFTSKTDGEDPEDSVCTKQ